MGTRGHRLWPGVGGDGGSAQVVPRAEMPAGLEAAVLQGVLDASLVRQRPVASLASRAAAQARCVQERRRGGRREGDGVSSSGGELGDARGRGRRTGQERGHDCKSEGEGLDGDGG